MDKCKYNYLDNSNQGLNLLVENDFDKIMEAYWSAYPHHEVRSAALHASINTISRFIANKCICESWDVCECLKQYCGEIKQKVLDISKNIIREDD